MSIIARVRPSVEVKATRVSKPRAVEFGHGILPTYSAERPYEAELRATMAGLGYDQAAVNASISWLISRGVMTAFPLYAREHWSLCHSIMRKYAQPPAAFRDLKPIAPAKAEPAPAAKPAPARECYDPSPAERSEFAEMMDEIERADREVETEYQAMLSAWTFRLSGDMIDADVALVGAVG